MPNQTTPPPPYDEGDSSCHGRCCRTNHSTHSGQGYEQPRHAAPASRMPSGQPSYVQIDSNNRVTTKIKATVTMEVEYSHPNVVPQY